MFILVSFLVFAEARIYSQEADPFLSGFFAVQQDDGVFIRWTIKAGNTCDGTRIQRFTEDVGYVNIGEIPGVCGNPDVSVSYDFTDSNPEKNKINRYRLEMGILGNSSPVAIEFLVLNDEGYSIQPNPVKGRSRLLFDNPENVETTLLVSDMSGRMVWQSETSNNYFFIDSNILGSGMFVFTLKNDNSGYTKGKILVIQ